MNIFEASEKYPGYSLWRLTVSGGNFSLADHHTAGRHGCAPFFPERLNGRTGEEPDWLKAIMSVGLMGGHAIRLKNPPPETIMWFVTTEQGELVTFVDPV